MNDLLIKYGYNQSGVCNCDGHHTHKFKSGNYEIRWRKNRYLFRVREGKDYITEWLPIAQAENKLSEIHATIESNKTVVQA